MHVAICADGIYPVEVGGMQRHTRLLVEHIARRHPEVRVTVIHSHPDQRFFGGFPSVSEVPVAPRPGRRNYILECWDLSGRIAAELRRVPDAVIYSQGIAVLKGIREFGPRLIVNPHGLESLQSPTWKEHLRAAPFRWAITRAIRNARCVVSLGGSLTDILRRIVPAERIQVLPNGVAMPGRPIARVHPASGAFRVLYVGRFAYNKGIPDLVEAARILGRDPDGGGFRFDFVGDGPLLDEMRASAQPDRLEFHGKVDDDHLESLYAASDVFVLPTLFEGMPTVVLEAMARGLPILVTDVGATRELVDDTNGRIIPKHDPAAIASALRGLKGMSRPEFESLGAASIRKVQERFTWDKVADAHVDLFRRLQSR